MKKIILVLLLNYCYGLAIAQDEEKQKKTVPDLPGIILVDFGFNFFKDNLNNLEINWFKSKSFGVYYMKSFKLGKKMTFNPAIGINFEKYGFTKDVTIGYPLETLGSPAIQASAETIDSPAVTAVAAVPNGYGDLSILDISYLGQVNKSQLAMNYLDIPIQFRYFLKDNSTKGGTYVALGGIVSLLMESHTKVKFKDGGRDITEKTRDDYQQTKLRYGLQARFGFGSFNFFYKQYFSNLFKGTGPIGSTDITTSTIGFSISGL
ncbi:MAG: PorT family protein [Cyclobacteriaceae bacterium]|jgi:hypothetical protein|nr:PorT family protein [Cyclobacteriaceae bacterium]